MKHLQSLLNGTQFVRRAKKEFTEFCHPSIKIGKGIHGEGVIATNDIPMGSILLIESGLYNIKTIPNLSEIEYKTNKYKNNNKIRKILDNLMYNNNAKYLYNSNDIDVQRFIINSVGGDLYPIISKINHGLPTNIVIFHSPTHKYKYSWLNNEIGKMIAVATDDIKESNELFYDYFNIISSERDLMFKQEMFRISKQIHNININDDIYSKFLKLRGDYNYYNKPTQINDPLYIEMFIQIINELYLNGICNSGCFNEINTDRISQRKQEIKNKIFKMEFSMQKQEFGGFFSQIAQSNINPNLYNEFIDTFDDTLCIDQQSLLNKLQIQTI